MRSGRLVRIAIVAVVVATGGAGLALAALGDEGDGPFHGSAVPPLFDEGRLALVDGPLERAQARGHRLAKAWLDAHPIATDAQFASWAVGAVGAPPGGAAQRKELAQLRTLTAQRDGAGVAAARWLEEHGKKQPWKLFLKQAKPFVDTRTRDRAKAALKAAMALGATLQASAKVRYARPSPYISDPAVKGLNAARFAGRTRLSYPSKHAVLSGAALALLEPLEPHRAEELRWMADEIAFSRLYAAGHYLSDLTAGALLGTLIGDYERRKFELTS